MRKIVNFELQYIEKSKMQKIQIWSEYILDFSQHFVW